MADTASALAGLREALARTTSATAQRLLDEPRLEVKAALAAHLHEDALAVEALDARIGELGGADEPVPATAEALLAQIDPLVDEASLRVLTLIAHQQRRHADDLDPRVLSPRESVEELDESPHVTAAEDAARALLQRDDPAFRRDMARIATDSLRHAIMARRAEQAGTARDHVHAEQALHARLRARWKL